MLHALDDLVYFRCSTGDSYAVQPPKREADDDVEIEFGDGRKLERRTSDEAKPETWLEYHDRLVREYFDGERELLKEIYPEKAPVPKRPGTRIVVTNRMYLSLVGLNFALVVMNVLLDNLFLTALWIVVMLLNLRLAVKIERR